MNDFWAGLKVFVTGATGMIGSWLVKELLVNGASVSALVRDSDPQSELFRSGDFRKISLINGTLDEFSDLERAINQYEVDTVFHLGAQALVGVAHRSPIPTFETNIRGTYNLLEVCRTHRSFVKRVVIASSDKAYGEQPHLPYTEDLPLNGRHPYEVSKSCADLIAQTYHHTYDLNVAIARCGNVYGGGDLNWSRIVPGTIRSFCMGERPQIRSDGNNVRDYIYVKDVARAYMRMAECLQDDRIKGEAFNFSCEKPITVLEMVEAIQKLMGCEHIPLDIRNISEGEIRSQYLLAAKARTNLTWRPEFAVEDGLRETINWYRAYLGV